MDKQQLLKKLEKEIPTPHISNGEAGPSQQLARSCYLTDNQQFGRHPSTSRSGDAQGEPQQMIIRPVGCEIQQAML